MASDTRALPHQYRKASESQTVGDPTRNIAAVYGFLGLFAALLALMKSKHEMYLDEGQAWLIARDSTNLVDLVHHLHYEGHPALWYLVLYIPAHLAPSLVVTMQYVHYAIAVGTAWLILSERRMSMLTRVLLVFGITFFFSMGVLARSYMLAAFLLIGAARCLQAKDRPQWLGILLLALAINTHFFAIPVAAAIFAWFYWLAPIPSIAAAKGKLERRQFWIFVLILGAALFACYSTLKPARDVSTPNYDIPGAHTGDYLVLGVGKVWSYFLPISPDGLSNPGQSPATPLTSTAYLNALFTIALWVLALSMLPGSRSRWFMIMTSLVWMAEVWATVHIPLLSHSSFLIVSYAIALTLTPENEISRSWLPSHYCEPLLLVLLSLQVSICGYFCVREWAYPFSGAKATVAWIENQGLTKLPIVIQPQLAGPAILAYTGVKSAYLPSCSCYGSFAVFKKGRENRRQITPEEIRVIQREFGVKPLLISDMKLTDDSLAQLGLQLAFTAPSGWAVATEDVFVYSSVGPPTAAQGTAR